MRLALLSDIHANIHALEACLADVQRRGGVDRYVFLGDLVGYGAYPGQVLDTVMAMQADGAWVPRGNHDEMALYPPIAEGRAIGEMGAGWTHAQMTPAHLAFLQTLPYTLTHESVYFVHASAQDPASWRYVHNETQAQLSMQAALLDQPKTCYVFGGHVHQQTLYYQGSGRGLMAFAPTPGVDIPVSARRRWIATVGSVGQPRDKNVEAMYAVFDLAQQKLCFHRVPYDYMAACEAIRDAGLPAFYADRLLLGQ